MHQQAQIALAAGNRSVKRSALARELGISRQWLSTLINRVKTEQLDGFVARSRAPKQPAQTPPDVEDAVVRLRKQLEQEGLGCGAEVIQWHLEREAVTPLPSLSTIWRICKRRGLIVAQPQKRPKSSRRRFEFASPNACWQIDCTYWKLAPATDAVIVNVLDDHSRVCVASVAVAQPSCEAAWQAFSVGTCQWGVPAMILSDNGTEFTGARFVENLAQLGVHTVNSRPRHPQTCGKVERFHQTMKRWLAVQSHATTRRALQRDLDRFVDLYNHHRPHRAIKRRTPATQWQASAPATAGTRTVNARRAVTHITAGDRGAILVRPWRIPLGQRWHHTRVTVFIDDLDIAVFAPNGEPIRTLHVDPTRSYQPLTNT
jgi:transposase InsO family protein